MCTAWKIRGGGVIVASQPRWVLRKYNGKHLASHLLERISPLRAFLRCYKEIVDELSTLVVQRSGPFKED